MYADLLRKYTSNNAPINASINETINASINQNNYSLDKDKYKYLREKEEYKDFIKYLYIGDLFDFVNEVVLKSYSLN